jgi:hypothetical protein
VDDGGDGTGLGEHGFVGGAADGASCTLVSEAAVTVVLRCTLLHGRVGCATGCAGQLAAAGHGVSSWSVTA